MAKKPNAAETEKKTFSVKSPLKHDGVNYVEGDEVDLTDAEAETLEAIGVIGPAADKQEKPPAK